MRGRETLWALESWLVVVLVSRSNDLGEHPLVAPGSVGACSAAAARKLWSPTLLIVRPVWKSRQMTTVGKKPHRLITRAHRVLIFAVGSIGRAAKGNEEALVSWRARMVIRVYAATCLLPCVRLGATSAPDLVCHQPGDHRARWCTKRESSAPVNWCRSGCSSSLVGGWPCVR